MARPQSLEAMSPGWWKHPVHALACGLGTGLSPVAPGTVGSLVGVALFWVMAPLPPAVYAAITVALALAGVFICGQTAHDLGLQDSGAIVYDDIVAGLYTLAVLNLARWALEHLG